MIISIPKEITKDEKRVAATPETVRKLKALGAEVYVESMAGGFPVLMMRRLPMPVQKFVLILAMFTKMPI